MAVRSCGEWESVPVFRSEYKEEKQRWRVSPLEHMESIAYAAFPFQPSKDVQNRREAPAIGMLHRRAGMVDLVLQFPVSMESHVTETLTAWCLLGGIGGRTRRGFGAIEWDAQKVEPVGWLNGKGLRIACLPDQGRLSRVLSEK